MAAAATTQSSPNILKAAHWVGVVDARPLALFRICLGATLLQDLWVRGRQIDNFLTNDGLFPLAPGPVAPWSWGLFHISGAAVPVTLIFAAGALATLAFTLGIFTRVATVATWLFWVSLHRRIEPIQTGGDSLADILLFFGFFVDLSGRFSLDALRRGVRAEVPALVFRVMQYLPGLLYLYTARQKLQDAGSAWFNGPIIFQHLHLAGWVRPLGHWMREHPTLCAQSATMTIVIEMLIPVLLVLPFWIRGARALAVLSHVALQLGIFLTLKVGMFTNVMFALTPLWVMPEWLDAAGARLARIAGGPPAPAWTRPRIALGLALAALFFFVAAGPVIPRHLPLVVHHGLAVSELGLKAGLFTKPYPSERWEAAGELDDGARVDPLAVALPEAELGDGMFNSLWMQLPYRLKQHAALGALVCRRYNRGRAPALRRWTLTHVARAPALPGQAPPPEARRVLWEQDCRGL